jgi:hypothetical protein
MLHQPQPGVLTTQSHNCFQAAQHFKDVARLGTWMQVVEIAFIPVPLIFVLPGIAAALTRRLATRR